jgi:hypothetical protein
MSRLFFTVVLLLVSFVGYAQDWEWVLEGEGIENLKTTSDEEGSFFASGNFKQSCKLGNTTITSSEKSACFILRFDNEGNILWWKIFQSHRLIEIIDIQAKAGVVYVGGNFSGKLKYNNENYSSVGLEDIFLASFDNDGNLNFIKSDGGATQETLRSFYLNENYIIATGTFSKGSILGGKFLQASSQEANSFYFKMNLEGNYIWIKEFLGDEDSHCRTYLITSDKNDNVYIGGIFYKVYLSESDTSFSTYGMLIKLSSDGTFLKIIDCINHPGRYTRAIEINEQKEFYYFGSANEYRSDSHANFFKTNDQNEVLWRKTVKGNSSWPLAIDFRENQIALLISVINHHTVNENGLLIENYNLDGELLGYNFIKEEHTTASFRQVPFNVSFASDSCVIISGGVSKKLYFKNFTFNNDNKEMQFIAKVAKDISWDLPYLNISLTTNNKIFHIPLSLHPNPTSSHFTLTFEAEKAHITITNFSGRVIIKREAKSGENISTSGFSKGIYFVQVKIGEEVVRRKLVVD